MGGDLVVTVTGGVAALNHRLMAVIPIGIEPCLRKD